MKNFCVKLHISCSVQEDGSLTQAITLCEKICHLHLTCSPERLLLSHLLSFTSSQNYSCYRKAAWTSWSWTDLSLQVLTSLLRNFASRVLKKQIYFYFLFVLQRNFLVSNLQKHWLLLFTTGSSPAYNSKGRK